EVGLSFRPGLSATDSSGCTSREVVFFDVDAAVASRNACLVGGVRERLPGQRHVICGRDTGLRPRASGRKRDRGAELVAPREQPEDLGASGAEVAVPRRVAREGRRREGGWLKRQPRLAGDRARAQSGARPRADLLAVEQDTDRRRGSAAHKRALLVPGDDAGIKDRVREREEELDVEVDTLLLGAMAVAARDELREEIPVAGRKLRVRTVRPVLGDHLLRIRQIRAQVDERLVLRKERRRAGG